MDSRKIIDTIEDSMFTASVKIRVEPVDSTKITFSVTESQENLRVTESFTFITR